MMGKKIIIKSSQIILSYLYLKSIILIFFERFGDFAVGAPFEDNGAGVVILYFGRKDIEYIDKKEIIKASPGHMGFGASFSKKFMDIDNNQLSDLAVGSYMSGDVVILRHIVYNYI